MDQGGLEQENGSEAGYTGVAVGQAPEHEVRYTSGETVYIEALVAGQWVGRQWAADGQIDLGSRSGANPAFELEIKSEPSAAAGAALSKGWRWESSSEAPGNVKGTHHFVVELSNAPHSIGVKVHTLLDGTPVLARWLEVTNSSDRPVALTAVAPWSGRLWPIDAPVVLGHSVKWEFPWEGWFDWTPLDMGTNLFENNRGVTWDQPYFVLRNESNGEYFFGQLAWPVNYRMEFHVGGGLSFKIGPSAVNALRVISAGETVTTPAVHLGHVKQDFDAAVQAMHDHVRRSVLPNRTPEKSYLVQYLIPEDQPHTVYRGDDFNETTVMKCIDVAAAAGCEVFILDGPTWAEDTTPTAFEAGFYGNWSPRKSWFPRGLEPVRQHAHDKGMLFGLYAELEGGRGDWSKTGQFQEHREWFGPRGPNASIPNFLNMAIPEAAAYMESELAQIIDRHDLDMYRHDMNGCEGGEGSETLRDGFVENDCWRHYDALHAIFERVHAKYPDLILQQASGGGARLDMGSVARWHEHYSSDRASHPYVYQMASGMSVSLPPEIVVTPNGMGGNNQPDLDTMLRGAYALGNTPMIFNGMLPGSVDEFEPGELERFLYYADIYKTFIRSLLPTCKVYHHAPVNATGGVDSGGWLVMEFAAPDRERAWAVIIRFWEVGLRRYLFKPRGLDERRTYNVTFDNTRRTEALEGSSMNRDGLSVTLRHEQHSELLLFEAR